MFFLPFVCVVRVWVYYRRNFPAVNRNVYLFFEIVENRSHGFGFLGLPLTVLAGHSVRTALIALSRRKKNSIVSLSD